jgi:hypothetical protein
MAWGLVKKLRIGGFIFRLIPMGICYTLFFMLIFFILRKREGILQFYFFRIFNSQGNILCFIFMLMLIS